MYITRKLKCFMALDACKPIVGDLRSKISIIWVTLKQSVKLLLHEQIQKGNQSWLTIKVFSSTNKPSAVWKACCANNIFPLMF